MKNKIRSTAAHMAAAVVVTVIMLLIVSPVSPNNE